jgi:hypothetical protein
MYRKAGRMRSIAWLYEFKVSTASLASVDWEAADVTEAGSVLDGKLYR